MAERFSLGIVTTLLLAAFAFPALFPGPPVNMIAETGGISTSLAYVLILAAFPAALGLKGFPLDRKAMGWSKPSAKDGLIALILAGCTVCLGLLFPAGEQGSVVDGAPADILLPLAALTLVSAAAEEIVFRSWLLRSLPILGAGPRVAFVFSVLAFALIHAGGGWPSVLFAGIAGTLYAAVFLIRGNLWTVIAAHVLHNALAFAAHAVP